jgi:hypothetical protein
LEARERERERDSGSSVTSSPVARDSGLWNEFSVNLGISYGILVMSSTVSDEVTGTNVLLETETMTCVFQEMGTVAYGMLGMGILVYTLPEIEMGTVACGFLGMGTVACAMLEMGILVYALLEIEMIV